jgi:hypothetical protein
MCRVNLPALANTPDQSVFPVGKGRRSTVNRDEGSSSYVRVIVGSPSNRYCTVAEFAVACGRRGRLKAAPRRHPRCRGGIGSYRCVEKRIGERQPDEERAAKARPLSVVVSTSPAR